MRQLPCATHRAIVLCAFTFLLVRTGFAQQPLNIFENYFVTGDYVVSGWVEGLPDGSGFAPGTISIPDTMQTAALVNGVPPGMQTTVPKGADIVVAYLYWGTVEGSQSGFAGQQAFFNGYQIVGKVLGNPKAPTSWSTGGCSGSGQGSKTMRIYRADVRPYLPRDLDRTSPTFGAIDATNGGKPILVRLADSGSNGNTQPFALGATLVIIYRVLSPQLPLNAIVLYDGSFAPNNTGSTMTQSMVGFYQPGIPPKANPPRPLAKLTHIVANGQPNKMQQVFLNNISQPLPSLYGVSVPPFPGIYSQNGSSWDNPTWVLNQYKNPYVLTSDTFESTMVVPNSSNKGCVNWGAMILSTTVQASDGDGLLDVWKANQGYADLAHIDPNTNSAPWVALPGAAKPGHGMKDLFVEVDYLTNLDGSAGPLLHSHLPKQAALDEVGATFLNQGINVHFDLGANIYPSDPYVVQYPIILPPFPPNPLNIPTEAPPPDAGGNPISEAAVLCTDAAGPLCAFPSDLRPNSPNNQVATSWKGGFKFVQNTPSISIGKNVFQLGDFQPGRTKSYRYTLSGHALGKPRSYWGTLASAWAGADQQDFAVFTQPQLVSIVVSGGTGTVTIKSPSWIAPGPPPVTPANLQPLVLKPGDLPGICSIQPPLPFPQNVPPPACSDLNQDRVTISGSLMPSAFLPGTDPPNLTFPLNGTYKFTNATSSPDPQGNGVVDTTFTITTVAPDGTYQYSCDPLHPTVPACVAEPQLGISYLGPTSASGHGDFGGGGDFAVTLGLWGADDPARCNGDPSTPNGQPLCDNQVGTTSEQFAAFLHEFGHTLTLTHGGTYYRDVNPSVRSYELNCKPNFLSGMNYLYEMRGFPDGAGLDYSGQMLPQLNETTSAVNDVPGLSESLGLNTSGLGPVAKHLPRWYSLAGPADATLQDGALAHCDGTPIGTGEQFSVRVEGTDRVNFSAPLDWNNDLIIDAIGAVAPAANGEDLNHNGIIGDMPFSGFNDWAGIDLQQTNTRAGASGFSGGGGPDSAGGGPDSAGGGPDSAGGGPDSAGGGPDSAGGGPDSAGGGIEQDEQTANSSVDAPPALKCTQPLPMGKTLVPACTGAGPYLEKGKAVPLTWNSPNNDQNNVQVRSYTIWRAIGSFTGQQIAANIGKFTQLLSTSNTLPTVTGTPPATSFIDTQNLKSSTTYTYFVTDSNKFGARSSFSTPIMVTVQF